MWKTFLSIDEGTIPAIDLGSTSVTFSWNAVPNAASYTSVIYSDAEHTQEIESSNFDASGNLLRSVLSTFTHIVQGLNPNTVYYYVLTAYDTDLSILIATDNSFSTTASTAIDGITSANDPIISTQYYNLQGIAVKQPQQGSIYIVRELHRSGKVTVSKTAP